VLTSGDLQLNFNCRQQEVLCKCGLTEVNSAENQY
jgi:hypothetical protein